MDTVRAPLRVDMAPQQDAYWNYLGRLLMGVVGARHGALWLGPVPLLRFGAPHGDGSGWWWPIEGGLLCAAPGGRVGFAWGDGELRGYVEGYHPRVPDPLYPGQVLVHHAVTRLFLLHLRGRIPPAGMPAEPVARLAAAGIDLALLAAVAGMLPRRGRLRRAAMIAVGYHLAGWTAAGGTVGSRAVGLRVISIDGSGVRLAQAILRLAALPWAIARRRAVHDEVAGTDVVRTG